MQQRPESMMDSGLWQQFARVSPDTVESLKEDYFLATAAFSFEPADSFTE